MGDREWQEGLIWGQNNGIVRTRGLKLLLVPLVPSLILFIYSFIYLILFTYLIKKTAEPRGSNKVQIVDRTISLNPLILQSQVYNIPPWFPQNSTLGFGDAYFLNYPSFPNLFTISHLFPTSSSKLHQSLLFCFLVAIIIYFFSFFCTKPPK